MAHPYSARVLDHFRQPRNVGRFARGLPGVGRGTAGSEETGALISLAIQVDKQGIISDMRQQTYGCGSTIAAASLATERAKGCTTDQAAEIHYADLARELELPPAKVHCAILAIDALRAALADFRSRADHEHHTD